MNLSYKWLNDYIDMEGVSVKDFCHEMTMSGSKVEGWDVEGEEISNVVAGKVISVKRHENSDRLYICEVDVGKGAPLTIVTGADNVNAGDMVPVALDGSTLVKGVKIKKGKLRGVESEGMLCSLAELGLSVNDFPYAIADGIMIIQDEEGCPPVEIGQDIKEALGLNDSRIEFEITSNRPDCLSVLGLAREARATFGRHLNIKEPLYKGSGGGIDSALKVNIQDSALCPRYIAGVVKNVKVGPSPRWLRERLRASGIRPINNFVDITNFVCLEYGHPMHAFDIRYIDNAEIIIRRAKAGEKITTLDGTERELNENILVIADANKPVAIAGVMGGEYSGIMEDTVDVVFESACFEKTAVRLGAKSLGMRTDASARFEKGLSPENALPAIKRAFQLVEALGCGEVVSDIIDAGYSEKSKTGIALDPDGINRLLGTEIKPEKMISILESLDFIVSENIVYPPFFRADIECMADVAEEIARIYGYNDIPKRALSGVASAEVTKKQAFERKIRSACAALGCNEILTYSFISPKLFEKINLPEDSGLRNVVRISNPLGEDTSVMRTTVLPSMLEALSRNYSARNMEAALFELGTEYFPDEDIKKLPFEPIRLCVGMYGGKDMDFFDIKGIINEILERIGVSGCDYTAVSPENGFAEMSAFHQGRTAVISKDGVKIGFVGEISQAAAENFELSSRVYAAKLNVTELEGMAVSDAAYKPLPKYPASTRDLAVICDLKLPAAEIEKAVRKAAGKILEDVKLFDVYTGKQVPEGKKSIAYSITMRSYEGTLTDEQSDGAISRILKELKNLGAELRT